MRQSKLTRESQKCDHGFYFGTTCERCELADAQDRITELEKVLKEVIDAASEEQDFWDEDDYAAFDAARAALQKGR